MSSSVGRSLWRLYPKNTAFFLCDIQEKFRPVMPLYDNLIKNTNKLLVASKALDVPLFATEQYPKGLGKLAKELDFQHACAVIEKTTFSMLVPEIECKLKDVFSDALPQNVVLFGVEAHVCVEQTALALLERNVNVSLVADCCCSRLNQDRNLSLARLRKAGVTVTTCESVIFNILQDKNHPQFNTLRKLFNEPSADMQLH